MDEKHKHTVVSKLMINLKFQKKIRISREYYVSFVISSLPGKASRTPVELRGLASQAIQHAFSKPSLVN